MLLNPPFLVLTFMLRNYVRPLDACGFAILISLLKMLWRKPKGNLFHNYQVYGTLAKDIRALVSDVKYDFAVDAVNENGVTLSKGVVTA